MPCDLGVSGFDHLYSEGDFEIEAADGEVVDAYGTANVDGLFPIVLRSESTGSYRDRS